MFDYANADTQTDEAQDDQIEEEPEQVELAIKLNQESASLSAPSAGTREHLRRGLNFSWLTPGIWSVTSAAASMHHR